MPRGIKKEVIYSKKGKILRKKKKDTILKQPVSLLKCILKMKNDPKLVQILLFFYQKMDIYEGLSELSRPRKALRGQKLNLGQFPKLKDGIGVAKS